MRNKRIEVMHNEIINFLTHVRETLSPASYKAYQADIFQFSSWLTEEYGTLNDLTPQHIKRYFAYLVQAGVLKSSLMRKIAVLRRFFSYSGKDALLSACTMPASAPFEQNDLTRKVILLLTEYYRCPIGHLSLLKREHIDIEKGIIHFPTKVVDLATEHVNDFKRLISDDNKLQKGRLFPYSMQALRALIKSAYQTPFSKNTVAAKNGAQLSLFAGTIPLADYEKKHPRS